MKKFFEEFKNFALKGNVMDLAIGVIIGAAFQNIVTAFTDSFINPIINSIGGASVGGKFEIFSTGQYITYGNFITAAFQQSAERSCRNAFAKRGNNTAGYKNILSHNYPPISNLF